jgi:hypothetical protein
MLDGEFDPKEQSALSIQHSAKPKTAKCFGMLDSEFDPKEQSALSIQPSAKPKTAKWFGVLDGEFDPRSSPLGRVGVSGLEC